MTSTSSRSPITCHVLNTHTGTPAAHLPCVLTIHSITSGPNKLHAAKETILSASSLPLTFTSTTDADGRISNWAATSAHGDTFTHFSEAINAHFTTPEAKEGLRIVASVKIMGVEEFYRARGVESFWPSVEVRFVVKGWEGAKGWRHYHVPVLLGPWSYSTYRGS